MDVWFKKDGGSYIPYAPLGQVDSGHPDDDTRIEILDEIESTIVDMDEMDQQAEPSQSTYTEFLYECGVEALNFSKERLKDAGVYNRFTKQFCPELYQHDVAQHNLQFNERLNQQNLSSVSSDIHYLDANKTANLFTRKQLISVLERMAADIGSLGDTSKVLPEFILMIQLLKSNNAVYLNIKEKAKISLSFDKISAEWKKSSEQTKEKIARSKSEAASGKERRQQWITKMVTALIDDLQCACKVQYVESAHEIMIFELAQGFKQEWKLGCVRSTAWKASIGATTALSPFGHRAGGGLSGFYEELKFTDPEGYWNIFRWVYGGLSAEAKASFEAAIPDIVSAKAFASGNVNVQGIYGKFQEPKTPQAFATGEFRTLIKEHSDNPDFTSYFSRARLLDRELSAQLNSELEDTLNEVEEIEQLRLAFNSIKGGMDHRLSLYMSQSLFPEQASGELRREFLNPSNKPTFASSPLIVPPDEITKATILGGVVKLSVGAEAKVSVDAKSEESGSIGVGAGLTVYGSGEVMLRLRDEVKRTPVGLRFVDGTKSDKEKDSIRQQVEERFDDFKKTIITSAQNEPKTVESGFTELGLDVLILARQAQKPEEKNYSSSEQYQAALQMQPENIKLFSAFLEKNKLDKDLVVLHSMSVTDRYMCLFKLNNARLTESGKSKVIDFHITTNEELKNHIDYLKQNFNEYKKLQAQRVGQDYQTQEQKQKALKKFEKRYGATRPEELIHRMHIASLYLLTHLDIEDPDNECFIEELLQFQNALANPPFAVDKNYLDDHLYFIEDLRITYLDTRLDLATKFSGLFEMASGTDSELKTDEVQLKASSEESANFQFKVNVMHSWLGGHLNKWRRGHLLQLNVTVGTGVNVQATIDAIAPDFKKHLPADVAHYALAKLKEKLLTKIALSGSITSEIMFDFTLGKPDKFSENSDGFEFSHLFSRKVESRIIDLTGKATIPAGPAEINMGGGYLSVTTDPVPLFEIYQANTVIQLFMLGMHEYAVGGINKITGVVEKDSNWNLVKTEQEKMLKQLFINFANEPDFIPDPSFDFQPDKRPAGAISREIFEIEKAIHSNENYLRQVRFMFENERRASSDPARRFVLTKKIQALTTAINDHNKSNFLGRELEEFNFRIARDNFKRAARQFRDGADKIDLSGENNDIEFGSEHHDTDSNLLSEDNDIEFRSEHNDTDSGIRSEGNDIEFDSERNDIDSSYKNALSCFKKLMFVDYPNWFDARSNSPDLKPRPLAAIDDADAMVAAQIQLAKASLTGMMGQYGSLDSYA